MRLMNKQGTINAQCSLLLDEEEEECALGPGLLCSSSSPFLGL